MYRIVIPDSHGDKADDKATVAAVKIVQATKPREVVLLGDHVDCGGIYSKFARHGLRDSYDDVRDFAQCREFLCALRRAAPRAEFHYLEGNHEQHVERWILSVLPRDEDARAFLAQRGVVARLGLQQLRIKYHSRTETIGRLAVPGVLALDGCYFTHGSSTAVHATYLTLKEMGHSIVHGHTHRAVCVRLRLSNGQIITGACPGTLSELQASYQHTRVSQWSHGVGLQHIDRSGRLWHYNVSIQDGEYVLP